MGPVFKAGDRVRHAVFGDGNILYTGLCAVEFGKSHTVSVPTDSLTPILPEPEWIDPTEEHIGLECRVRSGERDVWVDGQTLCAIVRTKNNVWYSAIKSSQGSEERPAHWKFCQVRNPKYKGA